MGVIKQGWRNLLLEIHIVGPGIWGLTLRSLNFQDEKLKWHFRGPKMTGEGTEFLALHC